jgi:hypothetical protein
MKSYSYDLYNTDTEQVEATERLTPEERQHRNDVLRRTLPLGSDPMGEPLMADLPDRASDSGPESSGLNDWRDWLYVIQETARAACRLLPDFRFDTAAMRNRDRIKALHTIMDAARECEELLCK